MKPPNRAQKMNRSGRRLSVRHESAAQVQRRMPFRRYQRVVKGDRLLEAVCVDRGEGDGQNEALVGPAGGVAGGSAWVDAAPKSRMWRNWQTRRLQVPVGVTPWRFDSSHPQVKLMEDGRRGSAVFFFFVDLGGVRPPPFAAQRMGHPRA